MSPHAIAASPPGSSRPNAIDPARRDRPPVKEKAGTVPAGSSAGIMQAARRANPITAGASDTAPREPARRRRGSSAGIVRAARRKQKARTISAGKQVFLNFFTPVGGNRDPRKFFAKKRLTIGAPRVTLALLRGPRTRAQRPTGRPDRDGHQPPSRDASRSQRRQAQDGTPPATQSGLQPARTLKTEHADPSTRTD